MNSEDRHGTTGQKHSLSLDDRSRLAGSGIDEVLSYDETSIVASCGGSELVIEGSSLVIISFERTSGRLSVEGRVDAVHYRDSKKHQSLLSRILR